MLRRGFTLLELLVVIVIVLLVTGLVIGQVLSASSNRALTPSAAMLQAAMAGARDRAGIRNGLAGIRLLPDLAFLRRIPTGLPNAGQVDPEQPLAADRIVPLFQPPDYSNGLVAIYDAKHQASLGLPPLGPLVLEQEPGRWERMWNDTLKTYVWSWHVNEPTSWAWTLRKGDIVRIGASGLFWVVGPIAVPNSEGFINYGDPGVEPPLVRIDPAPDSTPDNPHSHTSTREYLLLVNGQDDNHNGYTDEPYDGLDLAIQEAEQWCPLTLGTGQWRPVSQSAGISQARYTVHRRPAPSPGGAVIQLPAGCVIDLTGSWLNGTHDRSRLPVDPWGGFVDVVLDSGGRVVPSLPYSSPSSVPMDGYWYHFWLADCGDVGLTPKGEARIVTLNGRTGRVSITDPAGDPNPFTTARQP
jgi:prepilin-type N-terminal cleavage/methylation domain-containing protein